MRRPKKPKSIAALKKRLKPNKPVPSYKPDKKYMVLGKEGTRTKLIHFGAADYGHNITKQARSCPMRPSVLAWRLDLMLPSLDLARAVALGA